MTNRERQSEFLAKLIVFLFAAGLSVGAVFCFRGIGSNDRLLMKILLGAGGALTAVVAALAWLVLAASLGRVRGNLFLYDRKTKRNLPPEALTWELVREKLDLYFRIYLNGRRGSAIPQQMRNLLLPYILLTFLDSAPDSDWDRLLGGEKQLIDELSASMGMLGEDEIGRQLQYYYGSYRGDVAPAKAALTPACGRIREKLLGYIREHITEYGE